jgi:pimeloyl-ACP methyl ester carboxylesterase
MLSFSHAGRPGRFHRLSQRSAQHQSRDGAGSERNSSEPIGYKKRWSQALVPAKIRRIPVHAIGDVFRSFTPSYRGGFGEPMVCLHGFTDTWRTWELVLPVLERHHDVLAPTLPGHAGGPPLTGDAGVARAADAIEDAMDQAGFRTAHIVGNSLGGYIALHLAARGRAESVVALAPAGGWAKGDESFKETFDHFTAMQRSLEAAAPHAEAILASAEGRRRATQYITSNFEHIPTGLLAHLMRGAARCEAVGPMIENATREGWHLDAERITCPVRVLWGADDKLLAWPSAAARFANDWLPHADWVELDGIGHCPQLDIPLETAHLIVGFTARVRHVSERLR